MDGWRHTSFCESLGMADAPVSQGLGAYGGRRWLTTIGVILLASAMLTAGLIKDALWGEVVTWVFGIFATGNVTQRAIESVKDIKTAQAQGPQ